MENENFMYSVDDVCRILQCGKTLGYKYIRECNKELKEMGYFIRTGHVPKVYFESKLYGFNPSQEESNK